MKKITVTFYKLKYKFKPMFEKKRKFSNWKFKKI